MGQGEAVGRQLGGASHVDTAEGLEGKGLRRQEGGMNAEAGGWGPAEAPQEQPEQTPETTQRSLQSSVGTSRG